MFCMEFSSLWDASRKIIIISVIFNLGLLLLPILSSVLGFSFWMLPMLIVLLSAFSYLINFLIYLYAAYRSVKEFQMEEIGAGVVAAFSFFGSHTIVTFFSFLIYFGILKFTVDSVVPSLALSIFGYLFTLISGIFINFIAATIIAYIVRKQ